MHNRHKNPLKHKILTACAVILIVISIMPAAACSAGKSLKNTDFENGLKEWSIYNYRNDYQNDSETTSVTIDDIGFNGKCVKIDSLSKNDARIYQEIKVKPDTYYKVQFDTLYEGIEDNIPDEERGAGLNVSVIKGRHRSGGLYGSVSEWQTVTVYLKTIAKQKKITLSIGIGGYSSESQGKAYIDNVRIEKINSLPDGETAFTTDTTDSTSDGTGATGASIWRKLLFVLLAGGLIAFVIAVSLKADKEAHESGRSLSQSNPVLGRKDFLVLLVMVVVCSAFSFYKLGNMYAPSSYWKASDTGEYVIVEFDDVVKVSRSVYSNNIPANNESPCYSVSYEDPQAEGTYKNAFNIREGSFFAWEQIDTSFTTKRVKVTSILRGLAVNELGFFTKNENGEYVKLNVKVVETGVNGVSGGDTDAAKLFDEQDTVEPYSSYMSSTYFDEIYFPRTAYEHIHGFSVYETTHPPMGKIIISLGIRLFGMNPFGWRFMGTLFGVGLVPLMYLLGLKIFKRRIYAFGSAFLMMFDFMRLAQTRLATIDSYSAFFIILMYYFMYDYFTQKSYEKKKFSKSLLPLLFCGIMFGLGASTKWVCIYTGVGLAFLFFLAKYLEADDMVSGRVDDEHKKKTWLTGNFIPTCIACILFFIIIPGVIYVLSYIPYMAPSPDKSLLNIVIENQKSMYSYHSGLTEGHPYGSAWYTWPLDIRPIYYYSGSQANLANGMGTSIVSMGNPLVWWVGFACIIPALFYAWKKRDKGMLIVFVGFGVQFFPWILVTRVAFIYHYFTALPFVIFMIVYVIKNLIDDGIISQNVMWLYFALVLLLFIMFYPVLTAREVSREYINSLRWFSTWSF